MNNMILQKKISVAGAYARKSAYEYEGQKYEADIKQGDSVEILNDGQVVVGQFGEQNVFSIRTRNGEKNLAINQTSVNNLVDAFGEDTAKWVGKMAQVFVIPTMVSGGMKKVVYLAAEGWTMDDEGNFTGPSGEKSQDIQPEDIPF